MQTSISTKLPSELSLFVNWFIIRIALILECMEVNAFVIAVQIYSLELCEEKRSWLKMIKLLKLRMPVYCC